MSGVKDIYNNMWLNNIGILQGKLRTYSTYSLFKKEFALENYVSMLDRPSKSALCKLRISAKLPLLLP